MLFTEPFFLAVFLPCTLAIFYGVARLFGREAALGVVFGASCLFYLAWGRRSFGVMIVGTAVNFAVCYALITLSELRPRLRRGLFWTGQSYNFGTLIFFKYISPLLARHYAVENDLISQSIPVGISFYTFQQAVLLADGYARRPFVTAYLPNTKGLKARLDAAIRFGAFHCFFPQLVVGPITYLSEFAPQVLRGAFGRPRRVDFEVGLTLIVMGLFKKVVLADGLGISVDPVFAVLSHGGTVDAGQAWTAAISYFAQLYFDFSGYSDMALGIARLFGLVLPANFDSPLRASGIADFYRRWHITLTRVIARFLFTPLSVWGARRSLQWGWRGARGRLLSSWIPMLLNFEVIALWHGLSDAFILFGLLHGSWFLVETEIRATPAWRRWKKAVAEPVRRRCGQAFTAIPLMLTFSLFRSGSLATFGGLLMSLVRGGLRQAVGLPHPRDSYWMIAFAFAIIWLAPNSLELTRRYRSAIRTWDNPTTTPTFARVCWRPDLLWAILAAAMAITAICYLSRKAPFIYMGY